jgi:2-succinyl-5-enolpyruvyl-6-hydroxy-3-cyclohexene-1-carboxylate synthase
MPNVVEYIRGKEAEVLSNPNSLWGFILVHLLLKSGVTEVVVSPGSRSTPLVIALERQESMRVHCVLDERSASFMALGLAKASGNCVALVCTSGTAGANFYPAVIEALETNTPLLVLTADRPPELHGCHSGQTIDQQKLFGGYVRWYQELAVPSESYRSMAALTEAIPYAVERTKGPQAGPVQLNCPLGGTLIPGEGTLDDRFLPFLYEETYSQIFPRTSKQVSVDDFSVPLPKKGIIIAGTAFSKMGEKECADLANLQNLTGWPILADVMGPWRSYRDSFKQNLITQFECILRNESISEALKPEFVVQIGQLPTSKTLRYWLERNKIPTAIIDNGSMSLDPLGRAVSCYREDVQSFTRRIMTTGKDQAYAQQWQKLEADVIERVETELPASSSAFEGRFSKELFEKVPESLDVFIANGTIVRDAESFWYPTNKKQAFYYNRGANGIDGTLSTAIGAALASKGVCLFTGDLSFLHDTNGLLQAQNMSEHLSVVLMDNSGGGIFEHLPIAQREDVFERYFGFPQNVHIETLCAAYGVRYQIIQNVDELDNCFDDVETPGINVIHVITNRKEDAAYRKTLFNGIAENLTL